MDDFDTVIQAISTTGFPIAACCALFYLYDKTINNVTVTMKELTELIRELRNAIERKGRDGQN